MKAPVFEIHLKGITSVVKMDGQELPSVLDVKVHQSIDAMPEVTVTFRASEVKGINEAE